ncbi:MAG: hypothetical protein V4574_10220 [Pseudomonadota bacterium]
MILMVPAMLLLAAQAGPPPVDLEVAMPKQGCEVRVAGVAIPTADLPRRAKHWAAEGREVRITTIGEVAYRCIGGTIFSLQRGGVKTIVMMVDGSESRVPPSNPRPQE